MKRGFLLKGYLLGLASVALDECWYQPVHQWIPSTVSESSLGHAMTAGKPQIRLRPLLSLTLTVIGMSGHVDLAGFATCRDIKTRLCTLSYHSGGPSYLTIQTNPRIYTQPGHSCLSVIRVRCMAWYNCGIYAGARLRTLW